MIKIGDTGLLEGLPPGIAEQHWVKVIDAVYRERLKKELKVIERIHVYTAIDSLPEDLLDVLAVQFKVDWYRDDYPVETKRRVIKTAMEVRRYCGTEWAVKQAISAIYPNSEIVEWYDYGGTPGHWRRQHHGERRHLLLHHQENGRPAGICPPLYGAPGRDQLPDLQRYDHSLRRSWLPRHNPACGRAHRWNPAPP